MHLYSITTNLAAILRTGSPPVTNTREPSSPQLQGWLKPENSCLVPFTASLN
jgi:hypothetical protein